MRARAGRLTDVSGDFSCASCARTCRAAELDRHLWCEECIASARARSKRVGGVFGLGLAGALAAWIFLVQQPTVLIAGWFGAILATLWLGARIGTEFWYGFQRFRRRPR